MAQGHPLPDLKGPTVARVGFDRDLVRRLAPALAPPSSASIRCGPAPGQPYPAVPDRIIG